MKLTKEQIVALKSCSSAGEISEKFGNFVTSEQAEHIFGVVNGKEALSDDDLKSVSGSGCLDEKKICPKCGYELKRSDELSYYVFECTNPDCDYSEEHTNPMLIF